jgi:glyoxylase-like metal-dependent hydrolase (beta-lactamase superfamily II)
VLGLQVLLLGQHTPGSVAFYDPQSRALFCGDHVCFFGDPLPQDGPVSYAAELRQVTYDYFRDYMHGPDRFDDRSLALFIAGLGALAGFEAEFLCTSHGAVLEGNIRPFLVRLQEVSSI